MIDPDILLALSFAPAIIIMRMRKGKKKWILLSRDGNRELGEHDTRAKAEAQERAIQARKGMAARARR